MVGELLGAWCTKVSTLDWLLWLMSREGEVTRLQVDAGGPGPHLSSLHCCATCTGTEDDTDRAVNPMPDAERIFTLMVNALKEVHARHRHPRAGVRNTSGGRYDQATIDTYIRLILFFGPAAWARRARR